MADINFSGGSRLREPLPSAKPIDSLRTLMGLQSPANVRSLDAAGLDRAQGFGEYEPSEAELLDAQLETGGSVSRESLRSGAMSHVKQKLAQQGQQQQYKMQLEGQQQERELAKQRLANEGTANAARIAGDSRVSQAEAAAKAKQDALDTVMGYIQGNGDPNRGFSVPGVFSQPNAPRQGQQTQAQTVPSDMDKRLSDTRSQFRASHPMDYLLDKIPGGGMFSGTQGRTADYENALNSVLTRTGKMGGVQTIANALKGRMTAAQAIQQLEAEGEILDPYEQEYLTLKLGQ
jgi:hypothetical protein